MTRFTLKVLLALLASVALVDAQSENICISSSNKYTVKVNLFAGELGYYTFEECPGLISPTIGMKVGETYTFSQADRTNYYHPIGFAYFADGAHDDVDELEPGIAPYGTNTTCAGTLSCPAPMYLMNGENLGTYSNLPGEETEDEDNFGLDDYEPLFFRPIPEWTNFGTFEVKLRFDNSDFTNDLFYFCHIHQFMTGRIKLLKEDGSGLQSSTASVPEIPYAYDTPGSFDEQCGTHGLDAFQLPHPECPKQFVCNVPESNVALSQFSSCIDAMNCHMLAGMTTNVESQSNTALFIHQMVPHHQNAVNMAKALLKTDILDCDDLANDESDDCVLEGILWEIVNSQNFQIQTMYGILDTLGYPQTDDCQVLIDSTGATNGTSDGNDGGSPNDSGDDGSSSDNGATLRPVPTLPPETPSAATSTTRKISSAMVAVATVLLWN